MLITYAFLQYLVFYLLIAWNKSLTKAFHFQYNKSYKKCCNLRNQTKKYQGINRSSSGNINNIEKNLAIIIISTIGTILYPTITLSPSSISYARNLPESYGASKDNIGTINALIPIIKIETCIKDTHKYLKSNDFNLITCKLKLDKVIPNTEKSFKIIFDSYSNDISYKQKFLDQNAFLVYYTNGYDGPNRNKIDSNDYDSTSDAYKQKQQYGTRNEAWIAMDEIYSEVTYLLSLSTATTSTYDLNDLNNAFNKAEEALASYISYAPKEQVLDAYHTLLSNN